MNAHTETQIIEHNGRPAFAVIPWREFTAIEPELKRYRALRDGVPNAVAKRIMLEDIHPIRAWREHLGLEQSAVARAAGMAQSSLARLEANQGGKNRATTLARLADAMGLTLEQLTL